MFNEEISIFGKKANVVVFANPNKIKTLLACPICSGNTSFPYPKYCITHCYFHILIFYWKSCIVNLNNCRIPKQSRFPIFLSLILESKHQKYANYGSNWCRFDVDIKIKVTLHLLTTATCDRIKTLIER